jgi:hypothetical protein
MTFEDRLRRDASVRGVYEDLDLFGILRDEFPPGLAADGRDTLDEATG